ncbi:MAG: FHA domain-containing protein [Planctomycetota bacterium]|jgi:FHA domain|nr:MAG: FHA domain-containing protein [Planctomycetota bacterium]
MIICPFCHFENEDGALFCEQCKSDLTGVDSASAIPVAAEAPPLPVAEAIEEAMPFAMADAVEIAEEVPSFPMAEMAVEEMPPLPVAEAMPEFPIAEVVPELPVAEVPPVPIAAVPAAAPVSDDPYFVPDSANPRLYVVRGQKPKVEFPILGGLNFVGRADDKPVDIDLEDQENPERVWASRQHAVIEFEDNKITIEDLNSSNGTFLNRNKIYPGQKMPLKANDMVQIGNIQMKVML